MAARNEPTYSFAVVCEGVPDRDTACDLADRVLAQQVQWFSPAHRDDYRVWRGIELRDAFLRWASVPELAKRKRIRAHGHFSGEPGAPDARAARLALLLLNGSPRLPDAVLLIRDTDDHSSRRRGLEQARDDGSWQFAVVIGAAHPKRECWVLAGFDAQDAAEQARLAELQSEIGYDPSTCAERLTAQHASDRNSAKRVLAVLTAGQPARQSACWLETDLATLERRGQATGLAMFLQELRQRLVPVLQASPHP